MLESTPLKFSGKNRDQYRSITIIKQDWGKKEFVENKIKCVRKIVD